MYRITLSLLFCLFALLLFSQDIGSFKAKADSLFDQGAYTEAQDLYEQLLFEERKLSPAMALKLAYIAEGLDEVHKTLYYLSLHYELKPNNKTLQKMEKLAEQYSLKGYDYNDTGFLKTLYIQNREQVLEIGLLISGVLLILLLLLYFKKRQQSFVYHSFFVVTILTALIAFVDFKKDRAIVFSEQAYLMSGPSSASNKLEEGTRGNSYSIEDFGDIWLKLEVGEDSTAFVKRAQVRVL